MKLFLLIAFCFIAFQGFTQKYALLDQHISKPITYANKVTPLDKLHGLFPVEKDSLILFVNALEEISKKLTDNSLGKAKQYVIGCTKFTGLVIKTNSGERLDYVITSTCDNLKISMHLSDSKLKNTSNAFFINSWIKYIKSYI